MGAAVITAVGTLGISGFAVAQDNGEDSPDNRDAHSQLERINPKADAQDAEFSEHVVDEKAAAALPEAKKIAPDSAELKAISSWLEGPQEPEERDFEDVAVGSAEELMSNVSDEYEREGWHQEGKPTIVGSPSSAPVQIAGKKGLRVTVCLNDASVRVLDEDGRVVRPEDQGRRVLNTFDLVQLPDSGWQVVATGFPSDPRC